MKAVVTGTLLQSAAGFAATILCLSLAVILSVVVSPLHVVHFTNWRGLVGLCCVRSIGAEVLSFLDNTSAVNVDRF